jgi:hypothetical protein
MPRFERACLLCGKKVSSLSGLTRHTEICLRKRNKPDVENINNALLPSVTEASSEFHIEGYIPQREFDIISNPGLENTEFNSLLVDSPENNILLTETDPRKQVYYWSKQKLSN